MKPVLDKGGGSQYELRFPEINSKIYCDLEVRGDTVGKLHVSEAAFMKDSSKLKSTLQAVPLDGEVTIETTPNGMNNYFYDMWNDPDSIYLRLFFPWFVFNEYKIETENLEYTDEENKLIKSVLNKYKINLTKEQIAFRRFKKKELKISVFDKVWDAFEQEFPEDDQSCFLASGEYVVDIEKVKELIEACEDPISKETNGIKIFKEFNKTHTYICGADVSEGVGKDRSTAVMLNVDTCEIVASFSSSLIKPSDFALILKMMCEKYTISNTYPQLAVERNNHGHSVLLELDHLAYPNINNSEKDERPGFRTDAISRPIMIDKLIKYLENDYIKIKDKEILSEVLTLIDNNGKIEAATGKHDDLVIATAIALMIKPDYVLKDIDIDSKIKL